MIICDLILQNTKCPFTKGHQCRMDWMLLVPSQVPVLEVWSARGQGLRRKRKGTDSLCEMGLRDKF